VDWSKFSRIENVYTNFGSSGRRLIQLGDAIVLTFDSPELQQRWEQFRSGGASWDHHGYFPHVTISYFQPKVPLINIQPYKGPLTFGPEVFKILDVEASRKNKMMEY